MLTHEVIFDLILHGQGLEGSREGEDGGTGKIGNAHHNSIWNVVKNLAVAVSVEAVVHDGGIFLPDAADLAQFLFLFSDGHEEAYGDESDDGQE